MSYAEFCGTHPRSSLPIYLSFNSVLRRRYFPVPTGAPAEEQVEVNSSDSLVCFSSILLSFLCKCSCFLSNISTRFWELEITSKEGIKPNNVI